MRTGIDRTIHDFSRLTIDPFLSRILNRYFEDGTLSPDFDDTPNLELDFLSRALVGSRSRISNNLSLLVECYPNKIGVVIYRTKGDKKVFLFACLGLLYDLYGKLAMTVKHLSPCM